MIKSMTAYAEGDAAAEDMAVAVTVRSYNNRHLNTVTYLPGSCQIFEDSLKKLVAGRIARGRVEVHVSLEAAARDTVDYRVDEAKASAYLKALKFLKETFNVSGEITLDHLLREKDIVVPSKQEKSDELLWTTVSDAVASALEALDRMRIREGENLARDLENRFSCISETLDAISGEAASLPGIYRERLSERISALLSETGYRADETRIVQEAAILADKSDISEEIVRSRSHVKQAQEMIASAEPAGRKLAFIIQELNREFTTMGSKSPSVTISGMVVDLKSELEKIREQVQNIE